MAVKFVIVWFAVQLLHGDLVIPRVMGDVRLCSKDVRFAVKDELIASELEDLRMLEIKNREIRL